MYKFYYYKVMKENALAIGLSLGLQVSEMSFDDKYFTYTMWITPPEKLPVEERFEAVKNLLVETEIEKGINKVSVKIPNKKILLGTLMYSLDTGKHDTFVSKKINNFIFRMARVLGSLTNDSSPETKQF